MNKYFKNAARSAKNIHKRKNKKRSAKSICKNIIAGLGHAKKTGNGA